MRGPAADSTFCMQTQLRIHVIKEHPNDCELYAVNNKKNLIVLNGFELSFGLTNYKDSFKAISTQIT